jgi:hypothetical protein
MMRTAPQKPSVPIANPNLRNKMAPKIVDMAVKNTGAVPDLLLEMFAFTQVNFGCKKIKFNDISHSWSFVPQT